MKPGLCRGQLTKWNDDRGFGFIQPTDGSKEVFLHISELKDASRRPQVGDTIYYHVVPGKDGKVRACNAFILGAKLKPKSTSYGNKAGLKTASHSSFPTLEVLLLSSLPVFGAMHFAWTTANALPLLLYPGTSILTYVLYADDRSRARKGAWRTSEKMLHLCELAGGWIGGFIAQRILHHKSRKESYQVIFWVIVTIHHIFWLGWLFFDRTAVVG